MTPLVYLSARHHRHHRHQPLNFNRLTGDECGFAIVTLCVTTIASGQG
jgi:hypothetical protein